jgi:hypothetical protein
MKRTAAITQADTLRLRHLSRQIHRLGERPLYELLRELSAVSSAVIDHAEAFAAIDETILDIYGGRDLGPPTLWLLKQE